MSTPVLIRFEILGVKRHGVELVRELEFLEEP
jgi:hypothetical protein